MTTLIVEEGGKRRAFRMGRGVLTVGSGDEARLRVASSEVAAVHFDLVMDEAGCRLRPRPGVVPPTLDGKPLRGELVLSPGRQVAFGGVSLWVQEEGASAPATSKAATAPAVGAGARKGPQGEVAQPSRQRSVVQRSRPRVKKGLPGPVIVILFLLGASVLLLLGKNMFESTARQGAGPISATIAAVERHLELSQLDVAQDKLDAVPPERKLSAQEKSALDAIQKKVTERFKLAELAVENNRGTKYLDVLLKRYEASHFAGEPPPHKVRLFLKRCNEFKARWPTHPELEWVERQMSRLAGVVDLSAPPTWDDVNWEVKLLVNTSPRNYVQAFKLVEDFQSDASPDDRARARELRSQMLDERAEYHTDRLYQAKHEFETKQNPTGSVWWLVHSIAWLGDPKMADEAADFLIKMPELEGHLLGYKKTYPKRYEAVVENGVVARWAQEAGYKP